MPTFDPIASATVRTADHLEPDVATVELVAFPAQGLAQDRHQRLDFAARAIPVLDRERVEGEDVHA